MSRTGVLVVDDDRALLRLVAAGLSKANYEVDTADSGTAALEKLKKRTYDALLVDLGLPDVGGFEVLQHTLRHGRCRAVIVITGDDSVSSVVQAMRLGAADFVAKPFEMQALDAALRRALGTPVADAKSLEAWRQRYCPNVLGDDPKLLAALDITRRVADTDCEVLVTGESGTGKELFARAIHDASPRADKPFVALNCAALPRDLLESELFGHSKGAFTGAVEKREGRFVAANGGTLFLDEIGEMDLGLQAKLLRVVQEKELTPVGESHAIKVNVRIVSATNRDLLERSRQGQFREDLYFRLNVIPVQLPALRDRPADIGLLARHFVTQAARRHSRRLVEIDATALAILESHPWSGNVRELRNVIERAVVLKAEEGALSPSDLPPSMQGVTHRTLAVELPPDGLNLDEALAKVEIQLTLDALRRTGGNKAKAAELLGLKRTTLIERLKRLNLEAFASGDGTERQDGAGVTSKT